MKSAIVLIVDGKMEKVVIGENSVQVVNAVKPRMFADGKANLEEDMANTMMVHGYYKYNGNDGIVEMQMVECEDVRSE